ncbi:uncharacterized protein [Amphiura filiformis]|uniref:uncharacterized protein n=1 Tax=Amphiura filiformis TaxID=82378 RepID=UPI003B21278F
MFIRWMQNNAFYGLLCLSVLVTIDLVHAAASTKKGVGISRKRYMCEDLDQFTNITWWYDWGDWNAYHTEQYGCTNPLKENRIPMIWGWRKDPAKRFQFSEPSEYVLGFNEPNHPKQAYMSPQDAAIRWKELETEGRENGAIYFGSPAAAPGGDNYIEWFDTFFELCTDCQIDFLATHLFNCNTNRVMNFLTNLWERYGKKIWLTEFACPHTTDPNDQLDYMKEVLPLLEEADFVERYAWYCNRLTDPNGYVKPSASLLEANETKLTPLGEYYNNFNQ